jgi:hypothetical protein
MLHLFPSTTLMHARGAWDPHDFLPPLLKLSFPYLERFLVDGPAPAPGVRTLNSSVGI